MTEVSGVITCTRPVKVIFVPPGPLNKLSVKLSSDCIWDIGIDQSTSCTGICLQSTDGRFQILFDVCRDTAMLKKDFYKDLFNFLRRLVNGQQARLVVMEKPVPKAMYASRILEELKGHVEEWITQIPELEEAKSDSLFPQTWKSYIVDKSKGKNRTGDKRAVSEDLCDRFPLLAGYREHYPYKDYDSFDACGILNGYLDYAYTPSGDEKIHGTKEKRHVSLVGYRWVQKADVQEALQDFDQYFLDKIKILAYNHRFTLHDNIRMASSNYAASVTVLPRSELDQFMWKYGIDPEDENKLFVMFVFRKGQFSASDLNVIEYTLPWHEEVFGQ